MLAADPVSALAWYLRAATAGFGPAVAHCERVATVVSEEEIERAKTLSKQAPAAVGSIGPVAPPRTADRAWKVLIRPQP